MSVSRRLQREISLCEQTCNRDKLEAVLSIALISIVVATVLFCTANSFLPEALQRLVDTPRGKSMMLVGLVSITILAVYLIYHEYKVYSQSALYIREIRKAWYDLNQAQKETSILTVHKALDDAKVAGQKIPLINNILLHFNAPIQRRLFQLEVKKRMTTLRAMVRELKVESQTHLILTYHAEPLVKRDKALKGAISHVSNKLSFMLERRQSIAEKWDCQYQDFSWWNKIKYAKGPDYSEIDSVIRELELLKTKLKQDSAVDLSGLEAHYTGLKALANQRLNEVERDLCSLIHTASSDDDITHDVLRNSLWLSAMSIPVSAWLDVNKTLDVYGVLRDVNQNYAGLSNLEIYFQTLMLPTDSLVGLASLAKGAYFEYLVAAETGGELHEHFNTPDTDIIIDGTEFQLKATTDSDYVESVESSIPIIATSEVAALTDAIDSGISDAELSHSVELALGGSIVDVDDTAADAILTGLGGLGVFASIKGINHACQKYENGGDAVESLFEGLGVAIEGTARSLVGAAEMGYKALSSGPSRFVGRILKKSALMINKKLSGI